MLTTALVLALSASTAQAASTAEAETAERAGVDIEIDPLAYAIGGASVHVGLHTGPVRFDLGAFSLKVPEWLHGNEGFTAQGHGFGLKADLFPRKDHTGFHLGPQLDITHQTVTHDATGESALYREIATGGRVGYRIQHRSGLYVNPWIGAIYRITSPTEIDLGGETYTQGKVVPFPTVHLGWRL